MSDQLPAKRPKSPDGLVELSAAREIPAIVADAGNAACFAWEEFFFGRIRSTHTRRAYHGAVKGFLAWCEDRSLKLTAISPSTPPPELVPSPNSNAKTSTIPATLN